MLTAHEPHHHSPSTVLATQRDRDYEVLLALMQERLTELTAGASHLFVVDIGPRPYDTFVAALPADMQQHHKCHTCRHFVERFGGLVAVKDDGNLAPAMWPFLSASNVYKPAVEVMARLVRRAPIIGAHVSHETTWGTPRTYDPKKGADWTHFSVRPPARFVTKRSRIETASQLAAKVAHEAETLTSALREYPLELIERAHAMLTTGQLFRSEKCIGVAEWLLGIHRDLVGTKRPSLIWRAAASAPVGFCHVKTTMIGTLLDDIREGLPFADIKRKFDAKMSSLQYQRPTAAPSLGNIAAAEKLVDALGIRDSLKRRFARLEDVEALWVPVAPKTNPSTGGVFDHLKTTSPKVTDLGTPATTMTWEKFKRTVLASAEAIELRLPTGQAAFTAMITAVHPEAPVILSWGNPVSMYVYSDGSLAGSWGLHAGAWCSVNAVTRDPAHWYGATSPNHAERVYLLLDGARDLRHDRGGGFFPETLKSELHAVRSTLEAYAKAAAIAGKDEATACGLVFGNGSPPMRIRVTAKGVRTEYSIDRLD